MRLYGKLSGTSTVASWPSKYFFVPNPNVFCLCLFLFSRFDSCIGYVYIYGNFDWFAVGYVESKLENSVGIHIT